MEELWVLVRRIPRGRVAAYGALGAALEPPLSGFRVGRLMARCPDDVPWWRVVNRHGNLPVWKVDPNLERQQADRLASEGVDLRDGQVPMPAFAWDPAEP